MGEWVKPRGWGCKRLPTRYNGDWPLLFVDGDLQVRWEGFVVWGGGVALKGGRVSSAAGGDWSVS